MIKYLTEKLDEPVEITVDYQFCLYQIDLAIILKDCRIAFEIHGYFILL